MSKQSIKNEEDPGKILGESAINYKAFTAPKGDAEDCPFCDLYQAENEAQKNSKDAMLYLDHLNANEHQDFQKDTKSKEAAQYYY